MPTFTLTADIAAPPEIVFDVLTDHRSYENLTPLRSSTLEREGSAEVNGVGAIRRLTLAGPPIREEVTEYERPTRFAYRALSGVPAKEHTGTVQLGAGGRGTSLTWRVDSTPKLPLPDALYVAVMRQAIGRLLKGIVRESERLAPVAPAAG